MKCIKFGMITVLEISVDSSWRESESNIHKGHRACSPLQELYPYDNTRLFRSLFVCSKMAPRLRLVV